ncbi:hypothetical protein [Phytopseudomonas argentinensis]|uniref:hypothetical protein n=1 Tax=Phytopseudomonas argentinensis TaxID=289370 RepID=UPI001428B6AB|nr:hypothetical protein [Pseudomonas argentinensis]
MIDPWWVPDAEDADALTCRFPRAAHQQALPEAQAIVLVEKTENTKHRWRFLAHHAAE